MTRKTLKKLIILVGILLFPHFTILAQESRTLTTLGKILPFQSIKRDVEEVFGKSKQQYANVEEYETKYGRLSVFYSLGRCYENNASEFDLEKDTVINFNFDPYQKIKFSSLGLDLNDYKKTKSIDVVDGLHYTNHKKGISFTVNNNVLEYIEFSGNEDIKVQKCSELVKSP